MTLIIKRVKIAMCRAGTTGQGREVVKVSKERAAANRAAIVAAAERLFRERGFNGVGVAEITKAAGLTHGGFYGHFASKEALAAEACGEAFAKSRARAGRAADLGDYLAGYLSERHRDGAETGCPMPAYATEVARQGSHVQEHFAEGVERFVERLMGLMAGESDRAGAIALASAMVGGMALARATAKAAPELSGEILAALREQLTDTYDPRD